MKKFLLFAFLFVFSSCQDEENIPTLSNDQTVQQLDKRDKVVVCHKTGKGTVIALEISINALPAHLAHGDYLPDADGDGYTAVGACTGSMNDCNDSDSTIFPGAVEVCDGIDNNCNGQVDEGLPTNTYYLDNDQDGYGDPNISLTKCSQPAGYVTNDADCDDNNSAVNPNAAEVCGDNKDNDCDGEIDEGCEQPCGTLTVDYGGKTYNTVQIGTQCWLKENLDVGTMIYDWQDASDNGVVEKYCYESYPSTCNAYGGYYQWNEAMQYVTTPGTKGICPKGWHIPTIAEFQSLKTAAGNSSNALKAVGWGQDEGAGTNTSGFSAFLAGVRESRFEDLGYYAFFWSSTEHDAAYAYSMVLNYNDDNIILSYRFKDFGFSIRCIKD
jgi:uncharacterized protein (TIGR02145 family)